MLTFSLLFSCPLSSVHPFQQIAFWGRELIHTVTHTHTHTHTHARTHTRTHTHAHTRTHTHTHTHLISLSLEPPTICTYASMTAWFFTTSWRTYSLPSSSLNVRDMTRWRPVMEEKLRTEEVSSASPDGVAGEERMGGKKWKERRKE